MLTGPLALPHVSSLIHGGPRGGSELLNPARNPEVTSLTRRGSPAAGDGHWGSPRGPDPAVQKFRTWAQQAHGWGRKHPVSEVIHLLAHQIFYGWLL